MDKPNLSENDVEELSMVLKPGNRQVYDQIIADIGWYVSPQDIRAGYMGANNEDPLYIKIAKTHANGDIDLEMQQLSGYHQIMLFHLLVLPAGGYIYIPHNP